MRFSARRTAQVTNYNEDGEDDFAESEDDMTPNYWAGAVEETGPAIDKVLDHRFIEGGKSRNSLCVPAINSRIIVVEYKNGTRGNFEYLVSHFIH